MVAGPNKISYRHVAIHCDPEVAVGPLFALCGRMVRLWIV